MTSPLLIGIGDPALSFTAVMHDSASRDFGNNDGVTVCGARQFTDLTN